MYRCVRARGSADNCVRAHCKQAHVHQLVRRQSGGEEVLPMKTAVPVFVSSLKSPDCCTNSASADTQHAGVNACVSCSSFVVFIQGVGCSAGPHTVRNNRKENASRAVIAEKRKFKIFC